MDQLLSSCAMWLKGQSSVISSHEGRSSLRGLLGPQWGPNSEEFGLVISLPKLPRWRTFAGSNGRSTQNVESAGRAVATGDDYVGSRSALSLAQ